MSARHPDVVVRRAEARDAEALRAIFDAPGAMAGTLQLPYPSTAAWAKRIADLPADEFMLVAEVAGEVVGDLGLHAASRSPRRRHAGLVGMSVRDDWQGCGVGSALLAAAIDLADRWIGYTRLELTVYSDNAAALALYRKFGFEVEGTARRYAMRAGQYVDAYMMARHRPDDAPTEPAPLHVARRASSKTKRKRRP
jgi:putative acetyltransferase